MSSDSAFPVPKINSGSGMTMYEWAAVILRVPESGNQKLDEMIKRANEMQNGK